VKKLLLLLILTQFGFSQDSLMVRGTIGYAWDSTCMDQCSQYILYGDPGYENIYITILPNPSDLEPYIGEYVEVLGHMVDCFQCSALHADSIEIVNPLLQTVEGFLTFSNGWSFCMDGCDEFTLEVDDGFYFFPSVLNSTISTCDEYPGNTDMEITVNGNTIDFNWLNAELQCCLEPVWGILEDPLSSSDADATFILEFSDHGPPCDCMCSFDQTVTLGEFSPGNYDLVVQHSNYNWTFFEGNFTIEDDIQLIEQSASDCLETRDEPYIEVDVDGDYMTLNYFNAEHYCNLIPEWEGWLESDVFHVSLTDIGLGSWCECHFDLSATFGPFENGTYSLNFLDGELGIPEFTIGGEREIVYITTLGDPESIMEFNNEHVIITGYETVCAECSGIVPETIELTDDPDPCVLGDANGDLTINVLDIVIIVNCILSINECDECMDITQDGNINVLDIVHIINIILSGTTPAEECLLEPDIGPCDGACPRFFYNPDTEQCEVFFWGCCDGVVPFDTMESCVEMCE